MLRGTALAERKGKDRKGKERKGKGREGKGSEAKRREGKGSKAKQSKAKQSKAKQSKASQRSREVQTAACDTPSTALVFETFIVGLMRCPRMARSHKSIIKIRIF